MIVGISAQAQDCACEEQVLGREHMFCEKGALSNNVTITNLRNIICKGNAFKVAFDCKFWSECAKAGDRVNFSVPGAIYTQEGTLLIPAGSKVVGTVIRIEKQRIPNKNARESDRFLENGNFVRLRQAQLGYTLPTNILKKVYIEKLRFYVSGENLFTITKYSGTDPEFSRSSPLDTGIDSYIFPFTRSFTVGAQLTF